jgi:hypothetical protein
MTGPFGGFENRFEGAGELPARSAPATPHAVATGTAGERDGGNAIAEGPLRPGRAAQADPPAQGLPDPDLSGLLDVGRAVGGGADRHDRVSLAGITAEQALCAAWKLLQPRQGKYNHDKDRGGTKRKSRFIWRNARSVAAEETIYQCERVTGPRGSIQLHRRRIY